ncbi:hypothetical protein [Endozoicomonas ascidiicola]|uniref:hypothetical protein n=1 Tax=Endozoicomonas ascidiicola TaxID=1698521 RepID=UPI00083692C0|nr:hypothetical protein [Endozoicomonas ascidiicola]
MNKCSQEFLSLTDDCLRQFAQTESDELSSIITSDDLNSFQNSYTKCRVRDFPPVKTLTLFMRQVASDTKSCRHALIDEARDQVAKGNRVPSTHTDAYCKARQRLTEESINALLRTSGRTLDSASPDSWLWNQRRVLLTDGSTLLMPDTEQNQKKYPQSSSQKKGLDFPFSESLF